VALMLSLPAHCVGIPAFSLNHLIEDSDVIIAGRIIYAREVETKQLQLRGSQTTTRVIEAVVTPDNVLKGQTNGNVVFRYLVPDAQLGYEGVSPNTYRVVFLKQHASYLEPTSPYYLSLPAARHTRMEGNLSDSVIAAVAAVLESTTSTESEKTVVAYRLRNVRTDAVTAALKNAVADSSVQVRAVAVAALLARNETSVLPTALTLINSANTPQGLRQGIASAIYEGVEGVNSAGAIPLLTKLLTVRDRQVREAATMAIRRCHCREAIPILRKALDDPDRRARYLAVVGLAEITGQDEWRPLESEFNANEQKYLKYWRESAGGPDIPR